MADLVRAEDVSRRYRVGGREIVALASATCAVRSGARIALVGPSGSGKSTLLQLLGGLDDASTGTIVWPALGARLGLRPGKIAFVFQNASLLASLTAVENVEIPLLLQGVAGPEARKRAREALVRIDLGEIAARLPEELSGGQAQRVAFARALVAAPALLLADEPTGQLDRATADHLVDTVLGSLRGTPTALVVATHDPHVAERLDATWRIERGVLEAIA
jgi:putative ABC transport system ATP-binding protein/lipoprotein-releasing system ATP-binding protein